MQFGRNINLLSELFMKHAAHVLIKPCLRVASVEAAWVTNAGDCGLMGHDLRSPDARYSGGYQDISRHDSDPAQLNTTDKSCLWPLALVTADTRPGVTIKRAGSSRPLRR